jgi:hypothetical protein
VLGVRDRLNCAGAGCQDVLRKTMFSFHKIQELFVPYSQGADCKVFGRNELNQALFTKQDITDACHTAYCACTVCTRDRKGPTSRPL